MTLNPFKLHSSKAETPVIQHDASTNPLAKLLQRFFFGLCIATVVSLPSCTRDKASHQRPITKVNVLEVRPSEGVGTREYSGVVEEAFSASLSFGTGGQVTKVLVKEGQQVQEGQLLAQVDITRAKAAYRAASATYEQAQDGYDRARKVYEQGGIPEVKWVEVSTQLDQARATFEMAEKALEDCDLRAPCAGTISNRRIDPGTSVSPFQAVMDLVGLNGLRIKASVPEEDVASVMVGQRVAVLFGGQRLEAAVEEVNPVADPVSHSYSLRIRLQQSPNELRPGMVCRVSLHENSREDSSSFENIEIPSRAVQLDNEGRRYVWVVGPDSTAQTRLITIGDLTRTGVIVSEGLQSGDRVIVDGMLKISTGSPVSF